IITSNNADKFKLTIEGRVDTQTAPQLQKELLSAIGNYKDIVIDFSSVAYVSSAGLRFLLMGEKAVKKSGGSQVLINVSEEIMEIFSMTGFSEILTIEEE
ncbi:MAG: STAS domain-containing protein, partial [Clostridiales bacterium]|nr:STAS domain-containing protein [Clostridiales bacterium]